MKKKRSVRIEIVGIILVIGFGVATAIFISFMGSKSYIPSEYLQPIYVLIIVITGYIWIRIITSILEKVVEPTLGVTKTHGIKNLFYIIASIIIIAIISSVYNLNLGGVLIGAGFAGIVLGLAAQQVLGNIFA
ncbi:MAG: mechanosensitive ion channel, partial [Thaumarchaeota archaeon]|nr:mechanosensitive ion channel [Nitrososphaerota archaeon]